SRWTGSARRGSASRWSRASVRVSSPTGTPHRTRWSMSAPRMIVAVIGPGESEVGSFTEEHHLVSVGVGDREDASPSAWGGPVVLDPCSVHTPGQRVEVVDIDDHGRTPCSLRVLPDLDAAGLGEASFDQPRHRWGVGGSVEESCIPVGGSLLPADAD